MRPTGTESPSAPGDRSGSGGQRPRSRARLCGLDWNGDYFLTDIEAADLERAFEVYESSSPEIDREHRVVLSEVLADEEPQRVVEPAYHLANSDRP